MEKKVVKVLIYRQEWSAKHNIKKKRIKQKRLNIQLKPNNFLHVA